MLSPQCYIYSCHSLAGIATSAWIIGPVVGLFLASACTSLPENLFGKIVPLVGSHFLYSTIDSLLVLHNYKIKNHLEKNLSNRDQLLL